MSQLFIGEPPSVEYLWQVMYRQHFWHGHGILRATAVAGIEWIVTDDWAQMMCADFVHAVDTIYLARQQLVMGSHAAVHVLTNVVAKVDVNAEHLGKGEGPKTKHSWVNKGTVIKLTFQGFLCR